MESNIWKHKSMLELSQYFKGFDFDFLLIDEFSSTFVYQEQTMIKASIHYTK